MLEKEKRMIISVELTQEMIQELDVVVEKEKMGRSEVIMEATQQFLQEKRARELRERWSAAMQKWRQLISLSHASVPMSKQKQKTGILVF